MLSMTLNLNMSSSLAIIEEEVISRACHEYLRGFPHCLCCCFSVGNVFPESNSKRSCDLVGDNLVAGSVFNKGHLLKDFGSLNLRREGARMGSKANVCGTGTFVFTGASGATVVVMSETAIRFFSALGFS